MQVDLLHRPGNTAAKITLQSGECCTAEAGAMIAMSEHIDITTTTHKRNRGGILKAAKRMLAGESFFLNHFDTKGIKGDIWFGSKLAGDMQEFDLDNEKIIVQAGSFLVSEDGINMDMGWQGFKSIVSGENVFWLHLSGSGKLVLASFGAIYPVQVDGDYIVDSGHIVAFDETLDFSITKAGNSWLHSFLGGEGLVCKFHGRGTVWCQSHNPKSFGTALSSNLRVRKA